MVEAKLDKGRGPVATVLVQRGTLKVGDIFVVGAESGKVRAMIDDKGQPGEGSRPDACRSRCSACPACRRAGDTLSVVENEARAREVAAYRQSVIDRKRTTSAPASLDTMFSALKEKQAVEFPLVIKADVAGLGRGDRRARSTRSRTTTSRRACSTPASAASPRAT